MSNKAIQATGFDRNNLPTILVNIIADNSIISNIFTASECVNIVIAELNAEHTRLAQIYQSAEKRIKRTPKETAILQNNQQFIARKTEDSKPTYKPHISPEIIISGKPLPQDKRFAPKYEQHKKEHRGPAENVKPYTSQAKRSTLPRKGFIVLAVIFLVLVVMFFFVSLSQSNMWFGFCCFGILSGMFFVLAYSPKDAPCLFDKNHGIPKKCFVIACSIAAFLMPILSSYFE